METAEVLGKSNHTTVVEMMDDVGTSLHASVRSVLLQRLGELDVKILTGYRLDSIESDHVILKATKDSSARESKADAVVIAIGVRPRKKLVEKFEAAFDKITSVGDAHRPGLIGDAIREANDKAFVF